MYYVYMLRCQDGSLYTGTAADLCRRMHAHTAKTPACARYTRSHPPVAMEAAWQTEMRADALRLEALIKRLRRAQKLALIAAPETVFTVFGEKLKGAEFLPLPPERLTL